VSARTTVAAALALLLAGAFTGIASAEPAKGEADLRLTIAYQQAEYQPGANLDALVTVENVGAAPAEGFTFTFGGNYVLPKAETEKLTSLKRLEPGEKKSAVLVGTQGNANEVTGTLTAKVGIPGVVDPTPADNEAGATVKIVKAVGAVNGTVYVDADRDGKRDEGEGKAGVEFHGSGVVPLDAVTDKNGDFSFRNVPVGTYRLRFGGADGVVVQPGGSEFTVQAGKETLLDLAAVRPVSESLQPKLEFDQGSYGKDGQIGVAVTLTNKGTEALTHVVAVCDSDAAHKLPGTGWTALAPTGPGVDLGVGETKTVRVADVVPEGAYNYGAVAAACVFGNNGTFTDGYAKASAQAVVVGALGDLKGTVANGAAALADAALVALHPRTRAVLGRATTDAAGAWTMKGLPAGEVDVVVLGPWQDAKSGGIDHLVRITGGGESTADLSVVPGPEVPDPAAEVKLRVSVEFTADTFEADAQATLKVTLTNQTGAPLTAIARCDAGDLRNDTDGWGALAVNGPGVDLKADETKTVDVTAPIPQAAQDRGEVVVDCAIGPKVGTAFVTARDTATVTGALASASGSLLKPDGGTVADTKVLLVDPDTSDPVARATTDADGKFAFTDVPAGRYRPLVVGPWKVVDEGLYEIVRGSDNKHDIHVEPGPDVPDPDTTTPPETTEPPAEGGSDEPPADEDLAYTGASVIGIALLGGLVLALGLGAVLIGRRRGKAD
jgi:protocatechuate 3,4-dioxygenase beta subunit